jgi:ABC-type phosphate transport system substrate-binding protein
MKRLNLLAGTGILVATAVAGAASAQTHFYGGGSSLIAPYLRQAGDCYGVAQTNAGLTPSTGYLVQNVNPSAPPPFLTPGDVSVAAFNYIGTPAQNCATTQINTAAEIDYISTGSGVGIDGFYTHDANAKWGPIDGSGDTWAYVSYAMSETSLGTTDVNVFKNGGVERGITYAASGGQYPIPATLYGPLIQFPFSIDPVAIAYESTYKRVIVADGHAHTDYHLHLNHARAGGGLRLDAPTYCAIFNGSITNWNDGALTTLNGGVSLKDTKDTATFSVPLQIVGRSDSSGTTSVFTRHLANVCASVGGNQYGNATSTLPTGLKGPTYNKLTAPYPPVAGETVGKYTIAAGSDGVAKYVGAFGDVSTLGSGEGGSSSNNGQTIVLGRMGYVGPDFALPYVTNTGANNYGLNTADLANSHGNFITPGPKTALASYASLLAPQSTSTGAFCTTTSATCGAGLRSDPAAWVQAADKSVPIANPSAVSGYPIVGTTNVLLYQCYANAAETTALASTVATAPGFLFWALTSKTITDAKKGVLAEAGLSAPSKSFSKAAQDAFMTNKDKLGLQISTAQGTTTTTAAACKVSGIVGG